MTEAIYPAETLPDPMDVVWSYFPYDETPGQPGPKPHPCLVFQVNEYRPGEFACQVAFGSSKARSQGPHYVVANFNAMQFAGLNKVTTFDLGRFRWLPWSSRWFVSPNPAKWPTPKIGCVPADRHDYVRDILRRRQDAGLAVPVRI